MVILEICIQQCLKFDDAKGVIRSRTDNTIVTKKYKGTKNNLQNTTQKTNDRSTRIPTKNRGRGVISGAPKGYQFLLKWCRPSCYSCYIPCYISNE